MSFCIDSDYLQQCGINAAGGSERLWVADRNAVLGVTLDTNEIVTAISMAPAVPGPEGFFYEVEGWEDTTQFIETMVGESPLQTWEQTISTIFRGRNQGLRNFIQRLKECSCGVVVIHLEASGKRWIWGLNSQQGVGVGYSAKLSANEGNSGATFQDPNQETITLLAKTTEKARELDAALVIPVEP